MDFSVRKTSGLLFLTILAVFESLFLVSVPFFSSKFINALIDNSHAILYFTLLICGMLLVLTFGILKKWYGAKISRKEERQIQCDLLKEFQQLKPGYVESFVNGEIGMKFLRDTQIYGSYYRDLYPQFVVTICATIIAMVTVLVHNYIIALLFLLFMLLMTLTLLPFKEKFSKNNNAIRKIYDSSVNKIFEFIHIYPFLKSMASDKQFGKLPSTHFSKFQRINLCNDSVCVRFELYNRFILLMGEICVLGVAGYFALKKIITVGEVVFFQVLFLSVLNAFSSVFQLLPMWKNICEAKRSIQELCNNKQLENCDTGIDFNGFTKEIVAKDLSFCYPNSKRMIFEKFNCRIPKGSIVAVTGTNGRGKTTLMKLLTGYLEPTSGKILVDGTELSLINKTAFRRCVSYVFQNSLLITGTLKNNITLKDTRFTEGDIKNVLSLSGASSITNRMPDGLNYKIGFNGCDLSGGERQKIAIARALIRKPEILIFDEVTNHLDYDSRMKMRDLLSSMRGVITILIVSHDPELIKLCDMKINLN